MGKDIDLENAPGFWARFIPISLLGYDSKSVVGGSVGHDSDDTPPSPIYSISSGKDTTETSNTDDDSQ